MISSPYTRTRAPGDVNDMTELERAQKTKVSSSNVNPFPIEENFCKVIFDPSGITALWDLKSFRANAQSTGKSSKMSSIGMESLAAFKSSVAKPSV